LYGKIHIKLLKHTDGHKFGVYELTGSDTLLNSYIYITKYISNQEKNHIK